MSQKTNTYKIQPGDCLGFIAKYLNISIEMLRSLNSNQIKDIDFIYAGNVLNVDVGVRKDLPKKPDAPVCRSDLCKSVKPNFVDVLYVPVHPVTGKKVWYALSEIAKNAIIDEQKNLDTAITKHQETTLKNLNELGLLSKFENKSHDQFLEEDDALKLKLLTFLLSDIGYKEIKKKDGFDEGIFIKSIADDQGLQYDKIKDNNVNRFKRERDRLISGLNMAAGYSNLYNSNALNSELFEILSHEIEVKYKLNIIRGITKDVLKEFKNIVENLKKKAIKRAKTIKSDDNTRFVYDEIHKYYTSERQKHIYDNFKKFILYRPFSETEQLINGHNQEVKELIKGVWGYDLTAHFNFNHGKASYDENGNRHIAKRSSQKFSNAVLEANKLGYVFKEQCLSFAELVGDDTLNDPVGYWGPQSLNNDPDYKDWRFDDTLIINFDDREKVVNKLLEDIASYEYKGKRDNERIAAILSSKKASAGMWAYYPTLALIRFIDNTLASWLSDVSAIIGSPLPGFFDDITWVKEVANARIKQLKSNAYQRAKSGIGINYLHVDDLSKRFYTLIWDVDKYKPIEKKLKLFKNEAGEADLQIVECSLLSTGGNVGWIRGPAWYLPVSKKLDKSYGHVEEITNKVSFVQPQLNASTTGKSIKDAWKDIEDGLNNSATSTVVNNSLPAKLNLNAVIQYPGSAFWSSDYHWQSNSLSGGQSTYAVDAQAQLFRFASSAKAVSTNPLSTLNGDGAPNLDGRIGVEGEAHIDLARAQVSFKMILPADDNGFKELIIPYVAKIGDGKTSDEIYKAGKLKGEFTASLYGFAGASAMLSTELAFGPLDKEGGIGLRGRAIKPADHNKEVDGSLNVRVQDSNVSMLKGAALQSTNKVDVFAGVEVGAATQLKCFWQPPVIFKGDEPSDFMELGSVGAQISANVGVGFSGELSIIVEKGKIKVVVAAKVVCGPGVSGSWSVSLNAIVADRFLGCLLAILNESGFRYVSVLGNLDENGENPAFALLNTYLTASLLMRVTLAHVLLLPVVELEKFNKGSMRSKYSAQVAEHLLEWEKKQSKGDGRLWVNHLPPEVLANLFNCLLSKTKKPFWGSESTTELTKRITGEINKAAAIALIFKWMAPEEGSDKKEVFNCTQQFEKTLFLMGGYAETAASYGIKWERFASSYAKIEQFIGFAQSYANKYEESMPAYKKNITESKGNINKFLSLLASNMQGYRYTTSYKRGIIVHYIVHRKLAWGSGDVPISVKMGEQSLEEIDPLKAAIRAQKELCKNKRATAFDIWKI